MKGQLAFDLPCKAALRREDFCVSPANALALAAVERWRDWPQGKMVLVGPAGAGKTHLAHIWAGLANASLLPASALGHCDLPSLAAGNAVVVEDADCLDGWPEAERALFHLHNMLAERGGALLVTAAGPPRDWGMRLQDLVSRMQAAAVTRLDAPDDALLSAVLGKLFADRQITVPPTLIPFLVQRMDRSFAAARALVAALDLQSLSEGRAITRQMAAALLDGS